MIIPLTILSVLAYFGGNIYFDLLNPKIPNTEPLIQTPLDDYWKHIKLHGVENVTRSEIPNGNVYAIRLPAGNSSANLISDKQAIEEFIGKRIDIHYEQSTKSTIVTIYDTQLKSTYPYQYIDTGKPLVIAIGQTHRGILFFDIANAPHAVVAGETDSGKTICLKQITASLIQQNSCDLDLTDFQGVGLGIFKNLPNVVNYAERPSDFGKILVELSAEADDRLTKFKRFGVDKLETYNARSDKPLRYRVIVVDEFVRLADRSKECKKILDHLMIRVAEDRKVGFRYIMSAQRPTSDVMSGSIKTNVPVRICFWLPTANDSRTVLDCAGAERLNKYGHGLFKRGSITEFQGFNYTDEDHDRIFRKSNIIDFKEAVNNVHNSARPRVDSLY